jgi:hypothetical protein
MAWLLVVALPCGGCASVASLADTLHARGITSCLAWTGSYAGVGVHGVTATGGATIEQCLPLR